MKKTIFFIGIITCLLSCLNKKERSEIETESKFPNETIVELEVDTTLTIQYIENDSITHSWVSELTEISKNNKRFKVQEELKPNRHWDYMDTIKTLTFDKSRLTILSTEGYYGLWTAELNNPEIPLWDYIRVGMDKYQLEKTLATKITSDKVEVGNLEQTTVFEFEFRKDILEKIYVVGFVD